MIHSDPYSQLANALGYTQSDEDVQRQRTISEMMAQRQQNLTATGMLQQAQAANMGLNGLSAAAQQMMNQQHAAAAMAQVSSQAMNAQFSARIGFKIAGEPVIDDIDFNL